MLIVLVARDAAVWLPQCLLSLSRQTHPRLGVLAVDNASSDQSPELLVSALGEDRVIRLEENVGFPGAVSRALLRPAAAQADYVLLLHDDTVLAPDAVEALVAAAERIDGVGVVGPKVMDWEEPGVLLEIGLSTDRFGYPYSPLEEGEIDQGQYDRLREVLFVSSCAMLIARPAWTKIGLPDERLTAQNEALDFCWRARMAGFRVLMTPRAVVRHRAAATRGERGHEGPRRARYYRERAALASMLKNYGLLSLAWVLPLYFALGVVRVVVLLLSRRFEDAYQVAAAWGWNLAHLPGTLRRRVKAQAVRMVPDRTIRREMAPAGLRLRRWVSAGARALQPGTIETEDIAATPARPGVVHVLLGRPVVAAWVVGVVLAAIAYRHLLGASTLLGGGSALYPHSSSVLFRELVSSLRHTGLGGAQAASPALGILGLGSFLTLGNPALLEKILLFVLPAAAAVGCYRAVRAITAQVIPAVVAGGVYALSSAMLWAVSQNRLPVLVFLSGLPWLAQKISLVFDEALAMRASRWVAGAAVGIAGLAAFFPATYLAAAALTVAALLTPTRRTRRLRGLALTGTAGACAAVLVFPLTLETLRAGGQNLADHAGTAGFLSLARLSLAHGPGSWPTALFLPAAAALALLFVSGRTAGPAVRATVASLISLYLAWLASAGYLPGGISNAPAFVGVMAFQFSFLVGLGLGGLLPGVARESFGSRHLGSILMGLVLVVGMGGQMLQAGKGSWTVGSTDRIPPAYPLVSAEGGAPFRVLWLGARTGDAFPAPGGLPSGTVDAGSASVRFAVRLPSGASALDVARPDAGLGYDALRTNLEEILGGNTRHGGALLAPFGIRYVVAGPEDLPKAVFRRLSRQFDLNVVPTEGLIVLRNAQALPLAARIAEPRWIRIAGPSPPDPNDVAALPAAGAQSLGPSEPFTGSAGLVPSLVFLSLQYDSRWRLEASGGSFAGPEPAFGWGVGFSTGPGMSGFTVRYGGQATRDAQIALLVALWAGVMWLTRRPARHG